MKRFLPRLPVSQLRLVAAGVVLGSLARMIFGGPELVGESVPAFERPNVEPVEEIIDLPIIPITKQ